MGVNTWMSFYAHTLETLFSYVKDNISFLQMIDGLYIPEGAFLVTLDVECLYNSIPHDFGVQAALSFLEKTGDQSSTHNWFVLELLEFTLTHNYFVLDGFILLQVQGVAMGTSCTPSYVNLYLGEWKRTIFSDDDLTVPCLSILMTYLLFGRPQVLIA